MKLGGSYAIEYLTDEIAHKAMEYIHRIDEMGGALAAIDNGYMQNEIQESAYQYQRAVENKEQIIVGVNGFQVEEKMALEGLRADPSIEQKQCSRLADMRSRRDTVKVSELINRLAAAARGTENMVPLMIECVENSLTLGEICGTLRRTWGEYQPSVWR
jgi:methylmalonyl-CoA mutase N-terminal domain/subunit